METEGYEEESEQMYRFAKKNSHQYVNGEFNILFFVSDTEAQDELSLEAACNRYQEELALPSCSKAMRNLSAMMLIGKYGRPDGYGVRSIHSRFFNESAKPLPRHLQLALHEIRDQPPVFA